MKSPATAAVVVLLCVTNIAFSEAKRDDVRLVENIASHLMEEIKKGTIPLRDLEIQSFKGTVTITGRIENPDEASVILNSITQVDGVRGIRLNLGIGKQPTSLRTDKPDLGNWPLGIPK